MAPGSWGVRVVFSRFFGEDSGQTGEATGEPRVASHSWSCSLSYAPGFADQIAASRKEFAHEGSCPGGKMHQIFSVFSLFSVCLRTHGRRSSDIGFRRSCCHWKACTTLFLKVLDLQETELRLKRYGLANRGHQSVFGSPEDDFSIEIPARPGKISTI